MRYVLRKKGKATQHKRKTKQHNTTRPRQVFFKENCLGHVYTSKIQWYLVTEDCGMDVYVNVLSSYLLHVQYMSKKRPKNVPFRFVKR